MLNETQIKEFIQIYQEEFGVVLSLEEATEKATSVFNLFKTLLPIDAEDQKANNEN